MQRPVRPTLFPVAQRLPGKPEEIPQILAWFKQMREQQPVFRDERLSEPRWHVFRYDDVASVLKDHARFSSLDLTPPDSILADTLLVKDPPDHRKLRSLVNMAFTPRAVAHLADRMVEIMQELLDRVRKQGKIDIVSDIAFPLPARVIAEMLGVPGSDWDIFQRWARADSASPRSLRQEMHSYFSTLLEERRREPREDLITALSTAEIDGEQLSEYDVVSFCTLLLAAGQETTKNLIANFMLTLADHPEDHARLVREPHLFPGAVEEVLRYLPPAWFLLRRATSEVELSGVRIPAGQVIMSWIASANRDLSQFPDPDRFDIQRDPNRHLTFGQGIHFCIGAPLARLEAQVALPIMLAQLQDLQLVKDTPIEIRVGLVFVIANLPMTFRPY